jgi:hypothetical protein
MTTAIGFFLSFANRRLRLTSFISENAPTRIAASARLPAALLHLQLWCRCEVSNLDLASFATRSYHGEVAIPAYIGVVTPYRRGHA